MSSIEFLVAPTPAAPGIATNVSAVVKDDAGAVVATQSGTSFRVFLVQGLVPGANYTLYASCVDAIGGVCSEVTHRWRSVPCPPPDPDVLHDLRAVGLGPGKVVLTWDSAHVSADLPVQYRVDGGTWAAVPVLYPGVPPISLLVRTWCGWMAGCM
jgi:hypothetical protein